MGTQGRAFRGVLASTVFERNFFFFLHPLRLLRLNQPTSLTRSTLKEST